MLDNASATSWGPQASRQTNNVWHSACTGPIACIGCYGAEKPQFQLGGFSTPRFGLEKGRWMAGQLFTSPRSYLVFVSKTLYLREHARQNLQAQIFLVAQSISPSLQNTNLVIQSFDKAQRHLVLRLTIGSDAIPVANDHQGEILVRLQALPLQSRPPVLHEPSCPAFLLVIPQLAERFLQQIGCVQPLVDFKQFFQIAFRRVSGFRGSTATCISAP